MRGYEAKLIIGCCTRNNDNKGMIHVHNYATIDLYKIHYLKNFSKLNAKTISRANKNNSCYFYNFSDKKIKKSLYGDDLKPVSIQKVLEALQKDMQINADNCYIRTTVCLLKSIITENAEYKDIIIYNH